MPIDITIPKIAIIITPTIPKKTKKDFMPFTTLLNHNIISNYIMGDRKVLHAKLSIMRFFSMFWL